MEKEILRIIKYFNYFNYSPSLEEVCTFLTIKTTKKRVQKALAKLLENNLIIQQYNNYALIYTLGEYSINKLKMKNEKIKIDDQKAKFNHSIKKIKKIKLYIRIISLFPQIKLVGLSGSMAMMNAAKKDDIDLFIIAASGRLFTCRFIAVLLAFFLGLRRKREDTYAQDKVCLNLFFDEGNLGVPKYKQTEYVGHEVLQMKPLINKDHVYERFIDANNWVFRLFPNAKNAERYGKITRKDTETVSRKIREIIIVQKILNILEKVLKRLQLNIIKLHQTNEIITDSQLWFFPEDFEKKIIKKINKD